ncbi:CLEC-61.1 protein [Aphelenchoides avenae]|nr:CLEC-61.1 protein [Aphelenchus avenae]
MNSDPGDTLITTHSPTPSFTTPAPTKEDSACACNITNLWLDIYVVIDVSTSMSQHGLDDAGNFLTSIFDQFTVQPHEGRHSRASIVTYADKATLIGDLNKFDNDALDNTLPYLNCSTSGMVNIQSALQTVGQVFDKQGKYPQRRPVALILGTALSQDTSSDAIHAADNLKSAGFEIITIAYNEQDAADAAAPIGLLASSGLNFSSSNADTLIDQLTTAFCQANCFCLSPWNQWKMPGAGGAVERLSECLYISDLPSNSKGAKRDCKRKGACLVSEFSDAKHDYLLDVAMGAYPNDRRYLIGLSRQSSGEYVWTSKDAVTIPLTVSDYTNWNDGFPNPKSGDCVAEVNQSGNTTKWENVNCLHLQRRAQYLQNKIFVLL